MSSCGPHCVASNCHSRTRDPPRASRAGPLSLLGPLSRRLFERFGEATGNVETRLLGDLDESCRTGDVDLGQIIADDVESDHEQPLGRKLRSDAFRDLAITWRERPGY